MSQRTVIVLKFGGSVLTREQDLADATHEIYRWVREGWRVIAVVSALGKTTDRLLAQGHLYGVAPDPASLAALVATGELTSAALLGLALGKAGIPAEVLDAARLALQTQGPVLDSEPVDVDIAEIRRTLDRVPAIVVPGFLGRDVNGRTTLLGRGGSDFTALFLAQRLNARCRLVKDVKGLYERDPAKPGPIARRFRALSWDDALKLDGRIVQHKGVRFARDHGLEFEVGAINGADVTTVGPRAIDTAIVNEPVPPPLRVALLGLGTVGFGVYQHMNRRSDLFEITSVAVNNPKRHADNGVPLYLLTTDSARAARSDCEVIVETIGEPSVSRALIETALRSGKHVVTANKAVIAQHGPQLHKIAREHGVELLYSAAVGGSVPLIEAVTRLSRETRIESIEGVINGTTNAVLDRLASGSSLEDAVRDAQIAGFAEADPTRDLDGTDASDKLRILIRHAFGVELSASEIAQTGIVTLQPAAVADAVQRGRRVRLLAKATRTATGVCAIIAPTELDLAHPCATTSGESNSLVISTKEGQEVVTGKGAGRWPTAEAVVADLLSLARLPHHLGTTRRPPYGAFSNSTPASQTVEVA